MEQIFMEDIFEQVMSASRKNPDNPGCSSDGNFLLRPTELGEEQGFQRVQDSMQCVADVAYWQLSNSDFLRGHSTEHRDGLECDVPNSDSPSRNTLLEPT